MQFAANAKVLQRDLLEQLDYSLFPNVQTICQNNLKHKLEQNLFNRYLKEINFALATTKHFEFSCYHRKFCMEIFSRARLGQLSNFFAALTEETVAWLVALPAPTIGQKRNVLRLGWQQQLG